MSRQPASAAQRPRILIVDDEESTRLLLARIVSSDVEAEVQLAGTCEEALRLAEQAPYDAILLDLLMPGSGGFSVLREIRARAPNAETPVIIVSQMNDQRSIDSCMAAGANAYHVKPVRRTELAATIRSELARRNPSSA